MRNIINPTDEVINSPYLLDNIREAVMTVAKALVNQKKIYIQVDSDCDGYTSAAALINYLYSIAPSTVLNNVSWGIHSDKSHGIDLDLVTSNNYDLIIVPDASSNENGIHKSLAKHNIDIVVLDHHQAEYDDDDPAIIVNNQMSEFYENKALCGAGIVYQFCRAFDDIFNLSYSDNILDLVAIGNIGDMMDLRNPETRRVINKGLANIQNKFLLQLIEKQSFMMKNQLTPFTISFYIVPLINAITRVGEDNDKQILFQALLDGYAKKLTPSTKRGHKIGEEETIVSQAIRTCSNVKSRQEKDKENIIKQLQPIVDKSLKNNLPILFIESPECTGGLTGLLANYYMALYKLPCLVLWKNEEGNWQGSARGFEIEGVKDWRAYIANSGFANLAEGHPMAFGVEFTAQNLERFKTSLRLSFENIKIEPSYDVDFIWSGFDDFDQYILDIADYSTLWGQGVREPYVVLQNVPITKKQYMRMKNNALRLDIKKHLTTCVKFKAEEACNLFESLLINDDITIYVDIIGTCHVNEYNGNITPQLFIEDFNILSAQKTWDF